MLMQQKGRKEREYGKIFLKEGDSLGKLDQMLSELSSKCGMDYNNLLQLLKKREDYVSIPASLFNNPLCPLENVVLYLHIKFGFSQTEIAGMLERDHTTIWTTLEHAMKKIKLGKYKEIMDLVDDTNQILVPIEVFSDRKLSILESLSIYIKDKFGMSYHQIAMILGKNDRTVWTVVNRARKKLNGLFQSRGYRRKSKISSEHIKQSLMKEHKGGRKALLRRRRS